MSQHGRAKGTPKTGGRKLGVPNKVTADVRAAIAAFASANVEKMSEWLERVEAQDPAKAMDLYLRAIEYHIPKLGRQEHVGEGGGPVVLHFGIDLGEKG